MNYTLVNIEEELKLE